jgi:hypothetical protein
MHKFSTSRELIFVQLDGAPGRPMPTIVSTGSGEGYPSPFAA